MGGELGTCTVLASARDPVLGEALSTRMPLAQLGFCHMASRLPCSASQSATPPAAHAVMMTCTARLACSHSVRPYQGRHGQLPGLSTMHHKVLLTRRACTTTSEITSCSVLLSHLHEVLSACRAYLRLVLLAEGAGVVIVLQPHAQAAPCTDCFVIAAAYSHNLHATHKLRLTLVMRQKQ